jgi:hypothetical protein
MINILNNSYKKQEMRILFIDESYYLNCDEPFFVLGGVVIPEKKWKDASNLIDKIKKDKNITGEIKYKWIFNKNHKDNTLSHLSIDTRLNDVIKPILEFIKSNDLKIITTLTHINDLKKEFIDNEKIEEKSPKFQQAFRYHYYHKNYENIVQRFHYYLQECYNKKEDHLGIVICDGRSSNEDEALRNLHKEMIDGIKGKKKINYMNLIEHLLIAPSHYSVGIQFADIVAGVILAHLRKHQSTESLFNIISKQFTTRTTNQKETVEGAGVVKLPKTGKFWNKKMTQG